MDENNEMPWFKVERACIDHPVFTDLHGHVFRVYVFMLAKRAWYDGQPVGGKLLSRGETFASYDFIAAGCSIDKSKARRCIDRLLALKLVRKVNSVNDGVYRVCAINPVKIDTQDDRKVSTKYRIENENVEKKRVSARFKKPTVEEVRQFCIDGGYGIDPGVFINYYESNGWRVGKNPMKNWQRTVMNWAAKERKSSYETKERAEPTARPVHARVLDPNEIERARRERLDRKYQDAQRRNGLPIS